jgi:hypothetical protein
MSAILSKEQIRALYGATGKKGEVVAYGRTIKHSVPNPKRLKLEDLEPGSKEHTEFWERVYKLRRTPEQPVIDSQVNEIF